MGMEMVTARVTPPALPTRAGLPWARISPAPGAAVGAVPRLACISWFLPLPFWEHPPMLSHLGPFQLPPSAPAVPSCCLTAPLRTAIVKIRPKMR